MMIESLRQAPLELAAPALCDPPEAGLRRELARYAAALQRTLRSGSEPQRWERPSFGREVERARRHLASFRSRGPLAASFSRESFRVGLACTEPAVALGQSPAAVAYAIRWLELGDGSLRPAWPRAAQGTAWSPTDLRPVSA
jgi:hypothetical protein